MDRYYAPICHLDLEDGTVAIRPGTLDDGDLVSAPVPPSSVLPVYDPPTRFVVCCPAGSTVPADWIAVSETQLDADYPDWRQ